VLVIHDLVGMKSKDYIDAKFVKRYDNQFDNVVNSLTQYKNEVESREFPSDEHSYSLSGDAEDSLKEWKKEIKKILS
ncbi:MAG: 3-methyl-2-oxobutanoate hydroxymethyltransferase, partial [Actinomycetota bacterium]|nr:3-methyl-2-oxobutanoate hydroxymethyltransferase [Actinomycetota bacterium]